ncbi:hypothetical protein A8713_23415 [Streptomyces sp. SAT1]|uniref:hypothetical protein n=1 Tax=Streptomyces sp. SAT1 TaxID=1849967 RepID=UPI0007DDD3FD|nr:hypothetical protein [Streptomyces sp. SAT1]ANH93759.1 hypothetical protein A8713_23415 [Streptomyces sp. SAT1]
MSFDDAWSAARSEAVAKSSTQIDGVAPGGAGSGPDLRLNKPGKKVAVQSLQNDIRPGTTKAGVHADESSSAAVKEFSGWETGAGLKDAHAEWERQVKSLQARLEKDQSDLEDTHRDFQYVDHGIRSRIAGLGAGPDPRRGA